MNKHQMMLTAVLSSTFTLTIIAGLMLLFSQVMAAPATSKTQEIALSQAFTGDLQFVSISGLAFEPVQQNSAYKKNVQRQLLGLTNQTRNFTINSNRFIASLTLLDKSELVGMTVFGEDVDNLGEIRLRLKRCNHGQAFCAILAETASTNNFATGPFETPRSSILNETVDNRFYSYFLELELTALGNSGLRSVRLEVVPNKDATTAGTEVQWSLAGSSRSFQLPNADLTQVRICTNDLSHLPNRTHYPILVVDDQVTDLSSSQCVTVWGREIEIRRELNTGPSSGTYRFLR
jgi:hypothetical protein